MNMNSIQQEVGSNTPTNNQEMGMHFSPSHTNQQATTYAQSNNTTFPSQTSIDTSLPHDNIPHYNHPQNHYEQVQSLYTPPTAATDSMTPQAHAQAPPEQQQMHATHTHNEQFQSSMPNNNPHYSNAPSQSPSTHNPQSQNQQSFTQSHNINQPHNINTQSYATGNNQHPPQNDQNSSHQKSGQKNGKQNEKFMIIALLSSVILTAIIIGFGWTLFSPKNTIETSVNQANAQAQPTLDNNTATNTTPKEEVQDDVVIVYGANNNTETPAVQNTANTNPSNTSAVANTAAKQPINNTPLSASNITQPITKETLKTTIDPNATKYWIQIFSTTHRDRANQIKDSLVQKGITPTIVTKTINNTIYYRLRIGPYFNKEEGNKFLTWVRNNPNFKDAYISVGNGS